MTTRPVTPIAPRPVLSASAREMMYEQPVTSRRSRSPRMAELISKYEQNDARTCRTTSPLPVSGPALEVDLARRLVRPLSDEDSDDDSQEFTCVAPPPHLEMPDAWANRHDKPLPPLPQSDEVETAPSPAHAAPRSASPPLSPISTSPSALFGSAPSSVRSSLSSISPFWCEEDASSPPSRIPTSPSTLVGSPPSSVRSSLSSVRDLPFGQEPSPPPSPLPASSSNLIGSTPLVIRGSLSASARSSTVVPSQPASCSAPRLSPDRTPSIREKPTRKPAGPRAKPWSIAKQGLRTVCGGAGRLARGLLGKQVNAVKVLSTVPMPGLHGKSASPPADVVSSSEEHPANKFVDALKNISKATIPDLYDDRTPSPSSQPTASAEERPAIKFVDALKNISRATIPDLYRDTPSSPSSGGRAWSQEKLARKSAVRKLKNSIACEWGLKKIPTKAEVRLRKYGVLGKLAIDAVEKFLNVMKELLKVPMPGTHLGCAEAQEEQSEQSSHEPASSWRYMPGHLPYSPSPTQTRSESPGIYADQAEHCLLIERDDGLWELYRPQQFAFAKVASMPQQDPFPQKVNALHRRRAYHLKPKPEERRS